MATTKPLRKLETDSGIETARSATPTHEDIAQRAYVLYEARGREDGHDLDDWLQAERELLEEEESSK
jgi:outer membrane protein TolC